MTTMAFAQTPNTTYTPPPSRPQYVVQVKPINTDLEFTFKGTPFVFHCRTEGVLEMQQVGQKTTTKTTVLLYDAAANTFQLHKQKPRITVNQLLIYCEVNSIRFEAGVNVVLTEKK
ncbi:hypothetical protein [Deinococcus misasensis]|uniref:hypothetical protein n=1 Tax=Deinococcus misasensis TaxID=392413 RepID=UPI0012FA3DE6|nr:hypothetical protein [Deinococcus misasensis]